jgi:hypothetical protein
MVILLENVAYDYKSSLYMDSPNLSPTKQDNFLGFPKIFKYYAHPNAPTRVLHDLWYLKFMCFVCNEWLRVCYIINIFKNNERKQGLTTFINYLGVVNHSIICFRMIGYYRELFGDGQ